MPNRILKESICESESIASLSWFQEVFFYRLIVNCDDYGRFDARPKILRARLFPLDEDITVRDIVEALAKISAAGLVEVYCVDAKPFLQLTSWSIHQRIRDSREKYPGPEKSNGELPQELLILKQSAASCGELRRVAASCGLESESESISESISESEVDSTEPETDSVPAEESAVEPEADVEVIPLNDGSGWRPKLSEFEEWERLYPAVDVRQEIAKMRAWCLANPARRKTARGIRRFVVAWLSRAQDSPHGHVKHGTGPPSMDEWLKTWEDA